MTVYHPPRLIPEIQLVLLVSIRLFGPFVFKCFQMNTHFNEHQLDGIRHSAKIYVKLFLNLFFSALIEITCRKVRQRVWVRETSER